MDLSSSVSVDPHMLVIELQQRLSVSINENAILSTVVQSLSNQLAELENSLAVNFDSNELEE